MPVERIIRFFTSLRLTVACLVIGIVLIFWGTLAQVDLGLYKAQHEFFRSFFVYWRPHFGKFRIPIFPGGYLVGTVLLINLVAAHIKRFQFTRKKAGIWIIHIGLMLLLLGQLLTDVFSRETVLHLREGEAKNYSETERETELAVIDTSDPDTDKVVAIPQGLLARQKEIQHPQIPFRVAVRKFAANSALEERATNGEAAAAEHGLGQKYALEELPHVTNTEERDVPSAIIEILTDKGSLGTWLVSEYLRPLQGFSYNNRKYEITLRPRRNYKPFTLQLLNFEHELYAGTDIPKNFSSRLLLQRPETGEKREILIYMNNPLRYAGETFYQQNFDLDDHGTVLMVVRNPSWLTPYLSCVLVGAGLLVQFLSHLLGFALKWRGA